MKPKYSYQTQTEVPEALRSFYVEKDGKWIIDIEGAVESSRVAEFRDKNIALTKEIADLRKQWDGFSLEEVQELVSKKQEIEGAKIKSESEFNAKLKERTDAMKADYDKRIAELEKAKKENETKLAEVIIDRSALDIGAKLGLRPEAGAFLTTLVRQTFRMENGVPVAYTPDGKPIYDTEANPLTIDKFVAKIAKENAFAFVPSSGAGSQGGAGSGGAGSGGAAGDNPWKQGAGFNRTRQGEIFKKDPELAKRLAAEAGSPLSL